MSKIEIVHVEWAARLAHDIEHAQHSVRITTMSAQPPRRPGASAHRRLWDALAEASSRHLRVQFALPRPIKSHPATAYNHEAARWCIEHHIQYNWSNPDHFSHAKTALIDSAICWVGSGNWTAAACNTNREMYARIISGAAGSHMLEHWRACGAWV